MVDRGDQGRCRYELAQIAWASTVTVTVAPRVVFHRDRVGPDGGARLLVVGDADAGESAHAAGDADRAPAAELAAYGPLQIAYACSVVVPLEPGPVPMKFTTHWPAAPPAVG